MTRTIKYLAMFSLLLCGHRSFCNDYDTIIFSDTLKLTGFLIYDDKKEEFGLISNSERDTIVCFSDIKKYYKKKEYVFIPPSDVKQHYRMINGKKLNLCVNEKREEYIVNKNKFIKKRYYIIYFYDEYFVKIFLDKKQYITFLCW